MIELAGWVGPIATMVAAIMTAANLGPRVTGWGFVVFVVAGLSWSLVAIASHQSNLLWTNVFLTVVNAVGVWRWLGRQATYKDGGKAAAKRSAASNVPTLFAASSLMGSPVRDRGGETIGTIVDTMAQCATAQLAYVVVSEGGVGGVGERLHAVHPDGLVFAQDAITSHLTSAQLKALPVLEPGKWPAKLPGSARGD